MDVLKDASATAIFGSRGANGVIMITTKKGATGAPKIEFNTAVGASNLLKRIDVLDGNEYRAALQTIQFNQVVILVPMLMHWMLSYVPVSSRTIILLLPVVMKMVSTVFQQDISITRVLLKNQVSRNILRA